MYHSGSAPGGPGAVLGKNFFLVQIKIRKRQFHSEFDSEWNRRVRILIFFRIFEYWARSDSIWQKFHSSQKYSTVTGKMACVRTCVYRTTAVELNLVLYY